MASPSGGQDRTAALIEHVLLSAWLLFLTFTMLRGTLSLPWLSDDFNHMQLIAAIRAGLRPPRDLITYPYHGQTLVVLRLLFWLGTLNTAMDPTKIRIVLASVHAFGAVGCGILCGRWTGSRFAEWFSGTLYAGAIGFIGQVIWEPSSAIFSLAAVFLILAMLSLSIRWQRPRWGLAISLAATAIASLSMNGAAIAGMGLAVYCREIRTRLGIRPRTILLAYGTLAVTLAPLMLWNAYNHPGETTITPASDGIYLGLWLILTAPLRLFWSCTASRGLGFHTILVWSAVVWIPLLFSVRLIHRSQRRMLFAVWCPAMLLAMLVGVARAREGPGFLYTNDRYYYWFLLPLTAHITFGVTASTRHIARLFQSRSYVHTVVLVSTALALACALSGSRHTYFMNIPRAQFEMVSQVLAKGRVLAQLVALEAQRSRPGHLVLSDGPLPFNDTYMGNLSLAYLLYSQFPKGIKGVQVIRGPINGVQAERENAILMNWAAATGLQHLPADVHDGRLLPCIPFWIDFRTGAYEGALISGFSWWEGRFRWMARHAMLYIRPAPGPLVIEAYAPTDILARKWASFMGITVTVTICGRPAGAFVVSGSDIHTYRLYLPAISETTKTIEVRLTASVSWKARDVHPASLDDRELSVAIFAIGFRPLSALHSSLPATTSNSTDSVHLHRDSSWTSYQTSPLRM